MLRNMQEIFFFFLRQDMNKERYTISWGPTFQTLLSAAGKAWVCAGEGCSNSSWKRESEEVDSLLLKKLIFEGFPDGSVVKNLPANAGDMGSIPDTGRSHTEQLSPRKNYSVSSHPASPPFSDMRAQPVQLASSTRWSLGACLSAVSFNESLNG